MHEHTALIQCHASDLLLFILSRVPDASVVRATTLASLQSSILQKVVYCIHFGRLDLQTKLLALFHCTLQLLGKVDDSTGRTQSLQQRILSQRIDGSVESMELSTETNLYATWRGEASHGTLLEPRKLGMWCAMIVP